MFTILLLSSSIISENKHKKTSPFASNDLLNDIGIDPFFSIAPPGNAVHGFGSAPGNEVFMPPGVKKIRVITIFAGKCWEIYGHICTYHPQMVALVLDLSEVKTEQIKVEIQNQA